MSDPRDDLRRQLTEIADELRKTLDQVGRLAVQAARDVGGRAGRGPAPPPPPPPPPGGSATEAIRELGALRDAGLITEDEFQAKKTELLGRI